MAGQNTPALRTARIAKFSSALKKGGDAVAEVLAKATGNHESFTTLDGIMGKDEEARLSLAQVTLDMIENGTESGAMVLASDVDAMIGVAKQIGESDLVTLDGVQSIEGSGVIASAVAVNQFVIKNSQIGGLIGNISDMELAGSVNDKNIKFKIRCI